MESRLTPRKWWPEPGGASPGTLPLQKTGDRRADKKASYPNQYDELYGDLWGKNEMPPKELELFYFLASEPNYVFSREQL